METVEWDLQLSGGYKAAVTTKSADGTLSTYWVKKVITTPAVGVYQNNPNMFQPVPTQKWDAMNRVFEVRAATFILYL